MKKNAHKDKSPLAIHALHPIASGDLSLCAFFFSFKFTNLCNLMRTAVGLSKHHYYHYVLNIREEFIINYYYYYYYYYYYLLLLN